MKAVIFDASDLLYIRRMGRYAFLKKLLKKKGLRIKNPWIVYDVINRYSKIGAITRRRLIDNFLKVLGLYSPEFAEEYYHIYEKVKSSIILLPRVKEGLEELYRMGVKLYVFSDSSTTSMEKLEWFKKLGIAKYFDKVICSCDVGYLKSDIKKFSNFLRMINVRKKDAVFVYHELGDVVSAKLLGVTCVSITKGICEDYYIKHLGELPDLLRRIS